MMILNNTLFPVPLRPSTARVCPRLTDKLIPFRTLWAPKLLCRSSIETTGTLLFGWTLSCVIALSEISNHI